MFTLFEYGEQITVKDRKGLEGYLRFLWQDYKNLWVDENQETENVNNVDAIIHKMEQWNTRKITLFATKPNFIKIALKNINNAVYA